MKISARRKSVLHSKRIKNGFYLEDDFVNAHLRSINPCGSRWKALNIPRLPINLYKKLRNYNKKESKQEIFQLNDYQLLPILAFLTVEELTLIKCTCRSLRKLVDRFGWQQMEDLMLCSDPWYEISRSSDSTIPKGSIQRYIKGRKDISKHTQTLIANHKAYNGPFSNLAYSESNFLYAFGAKDIGFGTLNNFYSFCQQGGIDPMLVMESKMKQARDKCGIVFFKVLTFYSRDKAVAITCKVDPRKNKNAMPGRYMEVVGVRHQVKALERWLQKAGVGKNLYQIRNTSFLNDRIHRLSE